MLPDHVIIMPMIPDRAALTPEETDVVSEIFHLIDRKHHHVIHLEDMVELEHGNEKMAKAWFNRIDESNFSSPTISQ